MGLKPDHNNCPSALKPGLAVLNPCIPVLNLYLFPVPSVPSVFNFLVFLCALCVFALNPLVGTAFSACSAVKLFSSVDPASAGRWGADGRAAEGFSGTLCQRGFLA